jgi:acyl-CoA synthetase (AMP-forming)/AMP-acid ligase II
MSLPTARIAPAKRDSLALADERITLSWNALDPLLNRATNGLLATVPRPSRIAVCAHNSVETVIAYTAALQAGVSSVPVSYLLTAGEISYLLKDSGATLLFVGPGSCDAGLQAAQTVGGVTVIGWRCAPQHGLVDWTAWLAAASPAEPPSDLRPAPHLHYTSGTTGKPKGTLTPPSQFPEVATVQALADYYSARRLPSPGLVIGPNYHTGPLTTIRGLFAGSAIVTLPSFDPERVLEAIDHHKIASIVMVPTHFQRLLALPAEIRERYDVSSIQRIGHTGAACPVEVKRRMIDWFGPVLNEAYGGTEAGVLTAIDSAEWLRKPGSVGRAIPPFTTVILDENGAELATGEIGLVYFRDALGHGIVYHNDPEKTSAAHIAPGVFTLGEMGYVDEEGYLFITDRVSDMIVSGGVNIYPAEAEQMLIRHPGVGDVAIIGVPNAEMGEELKALIIPVDPANPPPVTELAQFCRAELAGYKCPRSYEFVSDVGRNIMGKVNKKALRQRYWPTGRTIGG